MYNETLISNVFANYPLPFDNSTSAQITGLINGTPFHANITGYISTVNFPVAADINLEIMVAILIIAIIALFLVLWLTITVTMELKRINRKLG